MCSVVGTAAVLTLFAYWVQTMEAGPPAQLECSAVCRHYSHIMLEGGRVGSGAPPSSLMEQ